MVPRIKRKIHNKTKSIKHISILKHSKQFKALKPDISRIVFEVKCIQISIYTVSILMLIYTMLRNKFALIKIQMFTNTDYNHKNYYKFNLVLEILLMPGMVN